MTTGGLKCRSCRQMLLERDKIITAHGNTWNGAESPNCGPDSTLWFIDEEQLPPWLSDQLSHSGWTKGKLRCFKCSSPIGGFDFVGGTKCWCKAFEQPSIHFVRKRVDHDFKLVTVDERTIEN